MRRFFRRVHNAVTNTCPRRRLLRARKAVHIVLTAKKDTISQFNTFPVPDVLVDKLLAECNPVHLKVYLFGLRQIWSGNPDMSNGQIACALDLSVKDVVNAFLYFVSKGLVRIPNFTGLEDTDFDVEYCFEFGTVMRGQEHRPSYQSADIASHLKDNPKLAQMYHVVSDLLGKNLSSADINILYSFYDWYALPAEVVIVLVEYSVSKGKRGMRAIEKEAGKWADLGINTVEKANAYIHKKEEFLSFAYRVQSALGLNSRKLTARELEFINKWHSEYHLDLPLIVAAYEKTVNQTGKLSFAYMNRILEDWYRQGILRPADIARDSKRPAPAASAKADKGGYDYSGMERRMMEQRILRKEGQ